MKGRRLLYIILWVSLFVCSCSRTKTPEKYIQFIDDAKNDLVRTTEIGTLKYDVKLETPEYTIIKQLGVKNLNKGDFAELLKNKENYLQFSIKISSTKEENGSLFKSISKSTEQYLRLNQYFEDARQDFYLDVDGLKVVPTIYYFTPNQGFANYEEIIIGSNYFTTEKTNSIQKIQLVYDDKVFGHGPLYFTFYTKDIHNIPKLKL